MASWFERNSVHHDVENLAEKFSHGGGSGVEAIYIINKSQEVGSEGRIKVGS